MTAPESPGAAPDPPPGLLARLRTLPPIAVVYTDFDGTLLGPGGSLLTGPDGQPSARAALALVDARQAGVTVVPVSGRRLGQLADDARLLGLADCIAETGSVIVRAGAVHQEWGACPRDLGPTPRAALEAAGALPALLAAFAGDLRPYLPWDEGRRGGFLLHGRIDVAQADAVLAAAGCGWAHVVDNGDTGGWPGRAVRAYHLLPRGVGKAAAVADDVAARGVDPRCAVAVGDSLEDATMATAVGTYVQVANGTAVVDEGIAAVPGAHGHGFADVVAAVLAARGG